MVSALHTLTLQPAILSVWGLLEFTLAGSTQNILLKCGTLNLIGNCSSM